MSEETRRLVALDLETTGLTVGDRIAENGERIGESNRIIEIGCVEIVGRTLTGRELQHYVDPQREIEPDAQRVHGITRAQLRGKPAFPDVIEEVLAFVRDAEVLIHNAEFDLGFLDYELQRMQRDGTFEDCCAKVTDTLTLARAKFPGASSLNQLCDHFHVDRSKRAQHGALLDAQLLAQVYLHMTGGQIGLELGGRSRPVFTGLSRPDRIAVLGPTEAERRAHAELLDEMERELGADGRCLWRDVQADP